MARTNVYEYDEYEGRRLVGWYDPKACEKYEESQHWDDQNMVSDVADRYDHQILYRTRGGRWVLHEWSQWAGRRATDQFVSDDQAREWLLICGHDGAVEEHFGELEEERGPGRPSEGDVVTTRIPTEHIKKLDKLASDDGVSRAEMIRRAVAEFLAARAGE